MCGAEYSLLRLLSACLISIFMRKDGYELLRTRTVCCLRRIRCADDSALPCCGGRTMDDLELQINDFLLELRDSGEINMFGAVPYLMDEFGLNKQQAKKYLLAWFQSFQPQEF